MFRRYPYRNEDMEEDPITLLPKMPIPEPLTYPRTMRCAQCFKEIEPILNDRGSKVQKYKFSNGLPFHESCFESMEQDRIKLVLVTGAAGFIGSHFVDLLLSTRRYRVIGLDNLSIGSNIKNMPTSNPAFQFVRGDIRNKELVNHLFSKDSRYGHIDLVVNFAAHSHVDRSISDPEDFMSVNVMGTLTLLNAATKVDAFLQVSTDEVYGASAAIDKHPKKEGNPLNPSSPYAASKAAADLLVQSYCKTYGLPTIISRCTNNFGFRQHPEKFIPKTIFSILENKQFPLYGGGLQFRDWLHVEDHCRALLILLENPAQTVGGIWNISADNEIQNLDVVNSIFTIMDGDFSLISSKIGDRVAHDFRYFVSSQKLREEFKWTPKIDFYKELGNLVTWYEKSWKDRYW